MRRRISTRSVVIATFTLVLSSLLGVSVSAQSIGPAGAYQDLYRRLAETPTPFVFSVYPEGGNGEVGHVAGNRDDVVMASLNDLRGDQPFNVHLFTAWSWHDQHDLDAKIERYTSEGYFVTLSLKYSPPPGREGDVAAYGRFVSDVVARHASNPGVHRYVIGNEANVTWGNPEASDGPFARSDEALVHGAVAARQAILEAGSLAEVGFNIAITGRDHDAAFIQKLVDTGGSPFVDSIAFMGVNVYPGLWPVGSGDAYADMTQYLGDARHALTAAGFDQEVSLTILENGYPTADDAAQANQLREMAQAVCDSRSEYGISGYSWFGLLDADSSSDNQFAHYGLLRSDLSARPSYDVYRAIVASGCAE